jgi:hypothetical protein
LKDFLIDLRSRIQAVKFLIRISNKKEEANLFCPFFFIRKKCLDYLTASLSALPAVNFGILAAGIVITSPVLGLRPFLDFLLTTEKVPNPTSVTFCPFFKANLTEFKVESNALDESALLNPVPDAILSISSAFVIYVSPLS